MCRIQTSVPPLLKDASAHRNITAMQCSEHIKLAHIMAIVVTIFLKEAQAQHDSHDLLECKTWPFENIHHIPHNSVTPACSSVQEVDENHPSDSNSSPFFSVVTVSILQGVHSLVYMKSMET